MHRFRQFLLAACRHLVPGFNALERIDRRTDELTRRLEASMLTRRESLYLYYSTLVEIGGRAGVRTDRRPRALTVSLTTIPSRLSRVHLTIESLLRQSTQPDRLVLWLDHESFDSVDLPTALQGQRERGLDLLYCDDIGAYKKLIPALQRYPEDVIATCDDDAFYPTDWLARLFDAYRADPSTIHCHRAHRIRFEGDEIRSYKEWDYETSSHEASFLTFPTGVGGTLYPPGSLHPDVLDRDQFLCLAPRADDVWFKAMSVKNGTRSHLVEGNAPLEGGRVSEGIYGVPDTQEQALNKTNWLEDENDEQIRRVFETQAIMERLRSEASNRG